MAPQARFADVEKEKSEVNQLETIPTGTGTDVDSKDSRYAASTTGLDHKEGVAQAERKLLRKMDMVILPMTALLYLSAYLDRGNIGNARLQGLQATILNGSDQKYDIVLTAFFITYIVFSIPGTLLAKAILPSTCIAMGCLTWSIAASGMAGSKTFGSVIVCRLFIGVGEAMFGQAVTFHYSLWYKKDELSKRLALFIGAGTLAGAFGGLIAFGVSHIKSSLSTWRILFLIEGLPSFVLAVVIFFFLPSRPDKSRFLTESERTILHTKLNTDNLAESGLGIRWDGVRRAFLDWKTYVVALLYSCMNLTLGSVSGFLPTIIKTMGYTNSRAQLFTVPPYAAAFVFMFLITSISDRAQSRGPFIAFVFLLSAIGWIILLAVVHNQHARYFATFLLVIGGYANIPLVMSWQANNTGSQSQRAVSLGMLNTIGQCLSILASFIFPSNEGPRWIKGFSTNLAFNVMGLVMALGMTVYYRIENKRRDQLEGPGGGLAPGEAINVVEEHDLARGFRYVV